MTRPNYKRFNEPGLSALEQKCLLELVVSGRQVQSLGAFRDWVRGRVRPLLHHETMVSAIGGQVGNQIAVERVVGIDHTRASVERLLFGADPSERHLIARWFRHRTPQLAAQPRGIAVHGVSDLDGRKGACFSFSGIPGPLTARHGLLLELIVPHVHQALARGLRNRAETPAALARSPAVLSPKEKEVLAGMIAGKTNRAIAEAQKRSAPTIRNQVHAILGKLGAVNRTEAVSKAISAGLDDLGAPGGRQAVVNLENWII